MPSLYHQALTELETRITAMGGWGSGGVQRATTFAVEREQRPSARIVAGLETFEHGKNKCEWPVRSDVTVSFVSDDDVVLDAIWLAFCAALKPAWSTPGVYCVLPLEKLSLQAEHDAAAYQIRVKLNIQFGPLVAYEPDKSK